MKRRRSRGRRAPWARSAAALVAVALAAAALTAGVLATTSSAADPPPQAVHTTSGPVPPSSVRPATGALRAVATGAGEHVVTGVPAYIWRDGCGPTSVGMIVGYYDGWGFPDLIPGEAADQAANPAVSQSIASHSGADFMHTSWSAEGLAYGWSWSSKAGPAFVDYVQQRLTGGAVSYRSYYYGEYGASSLTFAVLQQEVDAGRPLVLIVDCDRNGTTDHAVAAIGYRETGGYPEYACWDTWHAAIRWQRFRAMSSTYAWGVWGATALTLTTNSDPSPSPLPSTDPSASPSPTASPTPGDDTAPPVTTVTGADAAWHRAPVVLTFAAADDVAGVTLKTLKAGLRGSNATRSCRWRCSLPRGVYRYFVYATDLAGNRQARVGFARLTVR